MNCLEFQELLQRRLDGELIVFSPDVEQHVSDCSSCGGLQASAQALLDGLQALTPPQCPANLADRLTELVLQDRRQSLRRQRLHLVVTGSLAASVVGLAVGGYLLSSNRPDGTNPPSAVRPQPGQAPLAKSAADAQQALTALTRRWVGQAQVQAKVILTAANPVEPPEVAKLAVAVEPLEMEAVAQTLRQTRVDVVASVQPVAQTTRRAFSFFVHELPVLKK